MPVPRDVRAALLAAGAAVLERTGSVDAVSLRAVAREAGVTAPAVYGHFPDLDALLDAVLDEGFVALRRATGAAAAAHADPVDRLLAGCAAYVDQGLAAPARYRGMFGSRRLPHADEAFAVLVAAVEACVAAGRSGSRSPHADAGLIWTTLHGVVTLRAAAPDRPWPPLADQLRDAVTRLALIRDVPQDDDGGGAGSP
jgi:AcrR family transcriptional regulator